MRNKFLITESEKNHIMNLHGLNNDDIVISEWLSPDENYCIFLDDLYDIRNKIKIGNVWENFDNFKFFLKHCFETSKTISENLRESVLQSINSLVITESNNDMRPMKPMFKQFLVEEGLWDDFKSWVGKTAKGAVQGTKDFINTGIKGLKKTYSYIKDGDWKAAFDIIKKGALYVARKIRSAMYNPIGLILDAILVATGIGKGAQIVVWAIIVALDVYELASGDYEEPDLSMGWRLLFLGVDILGLVFAGAAAKSGKALVRGAISRFGKSTEALSKSVRETPALKSIMEKILSGVSGASGKISQAGNLLKTKSPSLYKWFSGIIGKLQSFLTKMVNYFKKILGFGVSAGKAVGKVVSAPGKAVKNVLGAETKLGKGAQAALNTGALVAGIGTYGEYQERKAAEIEMQMANSLQNSTVLPDYSGLDI